MTIQKSAEDYLETMLELKEQHGYIRSIDLAERLGVTKPSVSYAVKRLRENGYISMDKDKFIQLTDSGMALASDIYTKHKRLSDIFIALGVDPEIARKDAHRVEHDLSEETFDAICRYTNLHLKRSKRPASSFARIPSPTVKKNPPAGGCFFMLRPHIPKDRCPALWRWR